MGEQAELAVRLEEIRAEFALAPDQFYALCLNVVDALARSLYSADPSPPTLPGSL